jgi:glucose-6-phosphate 1-dehydrogenase
MNKPNLELELMSSELIKNKCNSSETYSQNLYAALCNNRFIKNNEEWTCSWRTAGNIVSEINGRDDYMDYYCSGMWNEADGFVSESVVTDEIWKDLLDLGWTVKPYELDESN